MLGLEPTAKPLFVKRNINTILGNDARLKRRLNKTLDGKEICFKSLPWRGNKPEPIKTSTILEYVIILKAFTE
jgi:hypothetical protein